MKNKTVTILISLMLITGFLAIGCDTDKGVDNNSTANGDTMISGGSDLTGWWYLDTSYLNNVFQLYKDGVNEGLWGFVSNVSIQYEQKTASDNSYELFIARYMGTDDLHVTIRYTMEDPATMRIIEAVPAPGVELKDQLGNPWNLNGQTAYRWE